MKNIPTSTITWQDIEQKVVDSFDDSDPGVRYALDKWKDKTRSVRSCNGGGKIFYRFTSPEVFNSTVEYFKAVVEEHLAEYFFKITQIDRAIKRNKIVQALAEHDGFFLDGDEDTLIPERLRVFKIDKTDTLRRIIDVSRKLAANDDCSDPSELKWPDDIDETVKVYFKDLTQFLAEHEASGRELILRVCDDVGYAKWLEGEENTPKPVRFLATIVAGIANKDEETKS